MLTKGQADVVLSALKSMDPYYAPVPPPLKERTKLPEWRLLEGLKDPRKESDLVEAVPCEFKVENLGSMLEQQLENEMKGMSIYCVGFRTHVIAFINSSGILHIATYDTHFQNLLFLLRLTDWLPHISFLHICFDSNEVPCKLMCSRCPLKF